MADATDLVVKESLLHPVVGTNVLEDIPGELLVELPGDEDHDDGAQADDARDDAEEGNDVFPEVVLSQGTLCDGQDVDGLLDLVNLDGREDKEGHVRDAHEDDLDRVLHPQRVPYQDQLVYEGEDEEREEGRDGLVLCVDVSRERALGRRPNVELELCKRVPARAISCQTHPVPSQPPRRCHHLRFEGQTDDGLHCSDEHEGPRPLGLEELHLAGLLLHAGAVRRRQSLAIVVARVLARRRRLSPYGLWLLVRPRVAAGLVVLVLVASNVSSLILVGRRKLLLMLL